MYFLLEWFSWQCDQWSLLLRVIYRFFWVYGQGSRKRKRNTTDVRITLVVPRNSSYRKHPRRYTCLPSLPPLGLVRGIILSFSFPQYEISKPNSIKKSLMLDESKPDVKSILPLSSQKFTYKKMINLRLYVWNNLRRNKQKGFSLIVLEARRIKTQMWKFFRISPFHLISGIRNS